MVLHYITPQIFMIGANDTIRPKEFSQTIPPGSWAPTRALHLTGKFQTIGRISVVTMAFNCIQSANAFGDPWHLTVSVRRLTSPARLPRLAQEVLQLPNQLYSVVHCMSRYLSVESPKTLIIQYLKDALGLVLILLKVRFWLLLA